LTPKRGRPVPHRIRPVFADRSEHRESADLGATVRSALEASQCLVVLCSPDAARSKWVDAEVRLFKSLGRAKRVLALILEGEPNASDRGGEDSECFPPALRHRVDESGSLTVERIEPVAADVRPAGDAPSIARLKIVAGVLGVPFDALRQRERIRGRRRLVWTSCRGLVSLGLAMFLRCACGRKDEALARQLAEKGFADWKAGQQNTALAWMLAALDQAPDGREIAAAILAPEREGREANSARRDDQPLVGGRYGQRDEPVQPPASVESQAFSSAETEPTYGSQRSSISS
jgi:hypothetical protein